MGAMSYHTRVMSPTIPKAAPNIAREKGLTLIKSNPLSPSTSKATSSASPSSAPNKLTSANRKLMMTMPAYTRFRVPDAKISSSISIPQGKSRNTIVIILTANYWTQTALLVLLYAIRSAQVACPGCLAS